MTNKLFHELFTPTAWEIYTSYLSELKALMEKYQINENRYSFIKKNLENHVLNWVKDAKVTIIDERKVQEIFHEIGQPLELLLALGFLFECRKCKTIRVVEKDTCSSCGTPYIPNIFSVSILGSSQIQKLKQWIFSYSLAKFTVFLSIGLAIGIGFSKFPTIIFILFLSLSLIHAYYNPPSRKKFDNLHLFLIGHFSKGLALIYIGSVFLIAFLFYNGDLYTNKVLLRKELVLVVAVLLTIYLWVSSLSKQRLKYFSYIKLKKKTQKRLELFWGIEFGVIILIFFIYLFITFSCIMNQDPLTIELPISCRIFAVLILVLITIGPFLDGLIHLFFLRQFIIEIGIKLNYNSS